jgi:hypothetical protein
MIRNLAWLQTVTGNAKNQSKMFREKKYQDRHIILKTLEEHYQINRANTDWIEMGLDFSELVSKSNLKEQEVSEQLHFLVNEKEIVDEELRHLDILYIISGAGKAAFYDKKYLVIGRREFLDNCYDVLKNISTAILLIFAVVTFTTNLIEARKNKLEIESLRNEVNQLKKVVKKNHQALPVTATKRNCFDFSCGENSFP